MRTPLDRLLATSALLTTLLLSACSAHGGAVTGARAGLGGVTDAMPTADRSAEIAVTPANHATAVPLGSAVKVAVTNGTLDSVVVTAAGSAVPVAGTLQADRLAWRAADGLDPAVKYTVDAKATSPSGDATTTRTTFVTAPASRLTTDLSPSDGATVGVGMPIKLHFNADIPADRQLDLVSRVSVSSTPQVNGAWRWFAPDEVHWRPQVYWPSGAKVDVVANFRGLDVGGGVWGLANWTDTFTIGDSHVSYIDGHTHLMTVTSNGQTLSTWPASIGRPSNPTIGGTLVVLYKQQDVLMDSLSIGIPRTSPDGYYEHVYWDTAISTNGFFVHSAPWSEASQGNRNVSHGCVNLSPEHAITFYNFSRPGDVVIASNTGRAAEAGDGEGDWQVPFAQFANSGGQVAAPSSLPGGI